MLTGPVCFGAVVVWRRRIGNTALVVNSTRFTTKRIKTAPDNTPIE
jgi:hypothetical protein